MENDNLKNEQQCAIHDVIHSVCPNCNIEMVKFEITDEHINSFNKRVMSKDKIFQYYCTQCEHLSFKHCV